MPGLRAAAKRLTKARQLASLGPGMARLRKCSWRACHSEAQSFAPARPGRFGYLSCLSLDIHQRKKQVADQGQSRAAQPRSSELGPSREAL